MGVDIRLLPVQSTEGCRGEPRSDSLKVLVFTPRFGIEFQMGKARILGNTNDLHFVDLHFVFPKETIYKLSRIDHVFLDSLGVCRYPFTIETTSRYWVTESMSIFWTNCSRMILPSAMSHKPEMLPEHGHFDHIVPVSPGGKCTRGSCNFVPHLHSSYRRVIGTQWFKRNLLVPWYNGHIEVPSINWLLVLRIMPAFDLVAAMWQCPLRVTLCNMLGSHTLSATTNRITCLGH